MSSSETPPSRRRAMNQLEKLNPLHKGRIQHPATGYSSTLSQNVEDMHKDFVAFQKTLKNLAMLYTTRHQLMESLNENGLYTAKCYNEMLGDSPLASVVAPGAGRHDHSTTSSVGPATAEADHQRDGNGGNADSAEAGFVDTDHGGPYNPDYDGGARRPEPDAGSAPGIRARARDGSPEAHAAADDAGRGPVGRDPPTSTKSVASGSSSAWSEGTGSPSRKTAPDGDAEDHGKSAASMVVSHDGLNIIVDDDNDTFIDAANVSRDTAAEMETLSEERSGADSADDWERGGRDPSLRSDASASGDEGTRSSDGASRDGGAGKEGYLNISNDGELVVVTAATEPAASPPPPSPPSRAATPASAAAAGHSYFDVHRAEYRDLTEKLEGHRRLVQYVGDWLETVSTRVGSRYYEYGKHRTSLNHYAAKVDALLGEQERLRAKDRPLKPKQVEKLERNRVKLTGARETHDDGGEALLMLMDEVIRRAWRDAFPLLQGSVKFECDFAAVTHGHMARLGGSLEVLEGIGREEAIAGEGRLELLRTTKIMEDIFTGETDGLFARAP